MRTAPIILAAILLATPCLMLAPSSGPGPVAVLAAEPEDDSWIDDLLIWFEVLCDALGIDCDFDEVDENEAMIEFRDAYWSVAPAVVPSNAQTQLDIEATWQHLLEAPEGISEDQIRLTKHTLRSFYEDVGGDPETLP